MTASIQPPRFLGQHDRDAIADRIGELGGARDQLLLVAVAFQRTLGDGADQHLEQLRIDAAGGAVGRRVGHGALQSTVTLWRRRMVCWRRVGGEPPIGRLVSLWRKLMRPRLRSYGETSITT